MADTAAPPRSLAVPLTAFAAGAVVAVLVGVFGKVHDPTLQGTTTLGFRTVIDMKVVLGTVVGVLAVLQILGGLWIYGRLGRPAPSWVGTAHRISGAVAVILAVFVAYSCLWALGLESGTLKDGEPVGPGPSSTGSSAAPSWARSWSRRRRSGPGVHRAGSCPWRVDCSSRCSSPRC